MSLTGVYARKSSGKSNRAPHERVRSSALLLGEQRELVARALPYDNDGCGGSPGTITIVRRFFQTESWSCEHSVDCDAPKIMYRWRITATEKIEHVDTCNEVTHYMLCRLPVDQQP